MHGNDRNTTEHRNILYLYHSHLLFSLPVSLHIINLRILKIFYMYFGTSVGYVEKTPTGASLNLVR